MNVLPMSPNRDEGGALDPAANQALRGAYRSATRLGAASGGTGLLACPSATHHHDHHHDHDHGPHGHSHVPEGDITLGSLIALGASGGLVPCPSALVLLLSSVALGRVGLGLLLLIAFSSGLAVVLMGIGVLVLYAKHFLPDSQKTAAHPAFRIIPVLSAALIVCIGLLMTGVSLGWIQPNRLAG